MAITKIANARNSTKTINYVKGSEKNPRSLAEGGQFCTPDTAKEDFKQHIKMHGKESNVHTYNVKVSFDESDFNPDSEEDVLRCADFADDYMREAFPNRLVHYGVHNDGKGGKMHIHFTVSNVDLDGKCARGNDMSWTRLAPVTDDVCRKHGLSVLERDENDLRYVEDYKQRRIDKMNNDGDYLSPAEETMLRQGRQNQSYKELLRENIAIAMFGNDEIESAKSLDEFKQTMKDEFDIDVVKGKRDLEYKFNYKNKAKSITARKLGSDYNESSIKQFARENAESERPEEITIGNIEFSYEQSESDAERLARELDRTNRERAERERKRNEEVERNKQLAVERDRAYQREQRERERRSAEKVRVHRDEIEYDDGPSL